MAAAWIFFQNFLLLCEKWLNNAQIRLKILYVRKNDFATRKFYLSTRNWCFTIVTTASKSMISSCGSHFVYNNFVAIQQNESPWKGGLSGQMMAGVDFPICRHRQWVVCNARRATIVRSAWKKGTIFTTCDSKCPPWSYLRFICNHFHHNLATNSIVPSITMVT